MKPEPIKVQKGVIRTNCMDNLDRTNVTQAAFAKWTLDRQLKELGILHEKDTIENYEALDKDFRESTTIKCYACFVLIQVLVVWTDHADQISVAYSGTGALKTDFTRTGKRSRDGVLQDGKNSIMRYLKNNFFDGTRQVSLLT